MELINVFDIMEMMTDFKYMHKYERIWEVLYYVAIGMAMVLISFPIEISADDLEENSKSQSFRDSRKSNKILEKVRKKIKCGEISCKETETKRSLINKPQNYDKVDGTYVRSDEDQADYSTYNMKISLHKIMKVAFTMLFNNIMFAMIRLKVMITEQSVEHGFTMITKNFILIALHLCCIWKMLKIYLGNRKQTDHSLNMQPKSSQNQVEKA